MKRCSTSRCKGWVLPSAKSDKCPKCKHRQFKARNPARYFWNCLKSAAKWRGIPFSLTFEEYRDFGFRTGYFNGKGKTASSLSIDRVDNNRGYCAENLQVLTLAENTRKRFVPRIRQYAEQFGIQL